MVFFRDLSIVFETILFRMSHSHSRVARQGKRIQKGSFFWRRGTWLGRDEQADEHILGTEDGVLPAAYALQQNYPNPYNPATVIRFSVAAKQAISLQIFDITGRLVKTIINEPFAPGEHEVTWQAGHLPSGTYFMQMKSGDFVKTRKMVLLK